MVDAVKKNGFLVIVILLAFFMFTGCPEKTKQTTSGNENNIADVTDLQLALLNHISYKEELKNLIGKTVEGHDELIDAKYLENITGGTSLIDELKGYTVIDYDYGDPTGFNAAAFTKGNNLVLVYVGTSDGKDIIEDCKSGLFDFSVQDGQAKAFAKDNVKAHKHFNVYITGYSMGGRLCYLGAEELFDSVLAGNLKKVCTFNGLGVKEAFDITDGNLSNIHNLKFKFGDKASNYVVEGDFVSDLSTLTSFKFILGLEHIGKVHRIPCTNEIDDGVMKQHDLYSIIDYLLERSLTEDEMYEIMSAYGVIGAWHYDDYDQNGTNEAFAVTIRDPENERLIDAVYFIDHEGKVTQMASGGFPSLYNDETDCFYTCQGKGFFFGNYGAFGSGYSTFLFSVKAGKPYELDISRKLQGFDYSQDDGCFYTTENDFSKGYHTYNKYMLEFDAFEQQFRKGDLLSEAEIP